MGAPRWLCDFADGAQRAGVAVSSASALDGVLAVTLAAPPGARPLRVEVRAREPGRRYFLETARFGVTYRGPSRLAAPQVVQLERLTAVIRSCEAGWPERLEARVGIGGVAAGTTDPDLPWCTVERAVGVGGEGHWSELLLRLTSRCNQQCPFCSAPPPHAEPTTETVLAHLDRVLPELPTPTVTLTGGEPTLWPGLPRLVERLLERPDVPEVKLQTNAVGFASSGALEAWPRSERLTFFVSFHGATAAIYDACTGTRGQRDLAVAGIRNLLAHGAAVVLNLVVCRLNLEHLVDWVRAVAELFPRPRPRLHLSITMAPDHRPEAREVLVRYAELAPRLQEAARLAATLGLECEALLSSSHASIPACLVAPEFRRRGGYGQGEGGSRPVQRDAESGVEDLRRPWVKSRSCAACRETRWCLGLPRDYVLRFGLDELRPLEPDAS